MATESTVSEAPRRGRPGPTGREGERAPRGTPHTPTPHAHTHAKAEERTAPGPHPTRGTPTRRPEGTRKAEAKRRRAGAALKGAEPETKPQGGRNRKGTSREPETPSRTEGQADRTPPKAEPTTPYKSNPRQARKQLKRCRTRTGTSQGVEIEKAPQGHPTEPEARPTRPHRKAYQPTTPIKAPKPTRPTYAKPEGTPRGSATHNQPGKPLSG